MRRSIRSIRPALASAVEWLEGRRLLSASLLKDINTLPGGFGPPSPVGTIGDQLIFRAGDGSYETRGLYRTDGTAAGTRLFYDWDHPIPPPPTAPADMDSTLFFVAQRVSVSNDLSEHRGPELWRTDGTEAGTFQVADIRPGPMDTEIQWITRVGDHVMFFANDGTHGRELWRSDGTPGGTTMVKDLRPGDDYFAADVQVASDGLLYFVTRGGANFPPRLWRSDGTETGTFPLKDLAPYEFEPDEFPTLAVTGGRVFFSAPGEGGGSEVWSSDGTLGGTALVCDVLPGPDGSKPAGFVAGAGGLVYFAADDGTHGREVWKTDGTAAGTRLVVDAAPGPASSFAHRLTPVGDRLFFFTLPAVDAYTHQTLWATDDTGAGAVSFPFDDYVNPARYTPWGDLVVAGQKLFFLSVVSSTRLYVSDGSSVTRLAEFQSASDLIPLDDGVAFGGNTGADYGRLFKSDGTTAGTVVVTDLDHITRTSFYTYDVRRRPVSVGGRAIFSARENVLEALWATDGTPEGTRRVTDDGFVLDGLAALGGVGCVLAKDPLSPDGALWRTDGTPAGTIRLVDLRYETLDAPLFTAAGHALYFSAQVPGTAGGFELWRTDGTAAGTAPVTRSTPRPFSPREMTAVGDTLYFTTGGANLWKTDGTEAGTVLVKQFALDGSAGGIGPEFLTAADGVLFFRAHAADGRAQLWKSDGTEAGTTLVRQFNAPRSSSTSLNSRMAALGGTVFFNARDDASQGEELWKSDGTAEGTVLVKDILPGPPSSLPGGFVPFNGMLYFSALAPGLGGYWQVWRTDGTESGTTRFGSFNWGSAPSVPQSRDTPGGLLYFSAYTDDGNDVWATDGTEAGTVMVHDGAPRAWYSPMAFTQAGDKVVFWANDLRYGFEPWVVPQPEPVTPPAESPATVVGRYLVENVAGTGSPGPAAASASGEAKTALLPGQSPSFSNVTNAAQGVRGVAIEITGSRGAALSAEDFAFEVEGRAIAPESFAVYAGAGAGGSDRAVATWPAGSVVDAWVRVTVKANDRTGLSRPDVFSFGSLVGDTGDAGGPLRVTRFDLLAVRRAAAGAALRTGGAAARFDIDRDGVVGALDVVLVKRHLSRALGPPPAAAPPAPPAPEAPAAPPAPFALRAATARSAGAAAQLLREPNALDDDQG